MLLTAGRTTVEVSAQTRDRRVRVFTGKLELDVPVELVEARVASDFRPGRSREDGQVSGWDLVAPSGRLLEEVLWGKPALVQMLAELLPRVVQCLVQRPTRRA